MSDTPQEEKSMFKPYKGPAGGWGAAAGIMTASLHIIKASGCWFAPQPPCWATCLARAGTSDFLPMKY